MPTILIIDDEEGICSVLKDVLEDEGYSVLIAEDGFKGLSLLETNPIDLVILDIWLPNMGGIDVLKKIKEDFSEVEVIIISGHANIDLAVKAVKMGAFDFLEKPLSLERTCTVVRNALALEDLRKENRNLKNTLFIEDQMIGQSAAIKKIRNLIEQSSQSDAQVLVLGENGTGKELVARAIHIKSKRAGKPFVEVNCAAIPETLIESELFGHEKGAFTSAIAQRKGKFELADGGTIFLDEIGDLSLSAQAKVLRVTQELAFERVGGEEKIKVDVRIISATNKELEKEIKAGKFREDLFFRLNVIPIYVPPLRERKEDILLLVDYFLKKFQEPQAKTSKKFSKTSLEKLLNYPWPGNVRELKNFIERMCVLTDSEEISDELVKQHLGSHQIKSDRSILLKEYGEMNLSQAKDEFEKQLIILKLKENSYNITKTAQMLGLYPSNLHSKIKKYGISLEKEK